MMTLSNPVSKKIDKLYDTLDWFDEHPERSITNRMALTGDGVPCDPFDLNAHCFCFAGRLAVEADIRQPHLLGHEIGMWLATISGSFYIMTRLNDSTDLEDRFIRLRHYVDGLAEWHGLPKRERRVNA